MTLTRPAPPPPGDDPLLWGAALIVASAFLVALVTGCGADVHVVPTPPTNACPTDCDDEDPCSEDRCMVTGCVHLALIDGTMCSSPDVVGGACFAGQCGCTADEQCDDGDPDTIDDCIISTCHHN